MSSSAIGIGGWAQGGPPRLTDTMAVVQGEAMSLDSLKKNKTNCLQHIVLPSGKLVGVQAIDIKKYQKRNVFSTRLTQKIMSTTRGVPKRSPI